MFVKQRQIVTIRSAKPHAICLTRSKVREETVRGFSQSDKTQVLNTCIEAISLRNSFVALSHTKNVLNGDHLMIMTLQILVHARMILYPKQTDETKNRSFSLARLHSHESGLDHLHSSKSQLTANCQGENEHVTTHDDCPTTKAVHVSPGMLVFFGLSCMVVHEVTQTVALKQKTDSCFTSGSHLITRRQL